MTKRSLYVPILWAKDGEYGALRQLSAGVKACVTPLLEMPPIPWDYVNDRPAKSIDQHVLKTADKIQKAWGAEQTLWLDFEWINPAERLIDGSHPVTYVFETARARGLKLVPVVTPARDDAYQAAVSSIARTDGRGVCFRVYPDDLQSGDLNERLNRLRKSLPAAPRSVDLLIDLRQVASGAVDDAAASVVEALGSLQEPNDWRSLVVAGTGFPDTLAGMNQQDSTRVTRTEWFLWQRLRRRARLRRAPAFGDYGISSPAPPEVDPRVMKPSASVRYTAQQDWVVFKGRNLKDHGYDQFHDVCRRVLRAPEYSGNDFSWGDRYIADCASRLVSRGNLTTWRKVGTSHHLAFVVDQLSRTA
jgi:hypothetical protein